MSFEESMQAIFVDAAIEPSPSVWQGVESTLVKARNGSFKKRLFFFQLVAAASLLFAATMVLYNVLQTNTKNQPIVSQSPMESSPKLKMDKEGLVPTEGQELTQNSEIPGKGSQIPDAAGQQPIVGNVGPDPGETGNDEAQIQGKDRNDLDNVVTRLPQINIVSNQRPGEERSRQDLQDSSMPIMNLDEEQAKEIGLEISRMNFYISDYDVSGFEVLPVWIKKESPDKRRSLPDQWAGAGLAAGGYGSSMPISLSAGMAELDLLEGPQSLGSTYSREEAGRSYKMGVGFGSRVSRRLVVQTGINYLYSEIDGKTNGVLSSNNRQYPVYHDAALNGTVQNVSAYDVTNSLRFASVPFKLGYLVLDRRLGWIVSIGLSSNVLINSSLSSDNSQLSTIDYTSSTTPFRGFNVSGIFGTQVYFNISENYQLALIPQYDFGVSPLTKSEAGFTTVPNSLNIGLQFSYILK